MKLTDELLRPELDSKYSELVEAVQEYDKALNEYEAAIENYEFALSNFKEGRASPVEMREAMNQFVYANNELGEAARRLRSPIRSIREFLVKDGEDSVVSMTTEHTLAIQKMEEIADNFSSTEYNFIDSLEEFEELDEGRLDTTADLMERDEDYLSENLDYSWSEAMDKLGDDMGEMDRMVKGAALRAKQDEIRRNPNDRYLGGFDSETGTSDLESRREEVLGPDSELQEKQAEVLGLDEGELEEARERIRDRKPRYIH